MFFRQISYFFITEWQRIGMKGLGGTYKTLIYLFSTVLFTILGLLYGKRKKIQQINDPNFMQQPSLSTPLTVTVNTVSIHEDVDNNDDNDLYEDSHGVNVNHVQVRDGASNAAQPLIEL